MSEANSLELEDLIQFATEVIQKTGQEALRFYGKREGGVRFDESLVTEAELVLSEMFRSELQRTFPQHQLFNNTLEDDSYTHEAKRYVWVYDTLDGIANFQAGIPMWGVSLALLENFWPILGLFYMPATGDLFKAIAKEAAYRGENQIKVGDREEIDDQSILLVFSRFHQQFQSSFPGKLLNLGCTSAHICYVASGLADAAVIANESFQDLAATRVIIEAAGGKIYRMDGSEFHLNEYLKGQKIQEPLLISGPDGFGQVRGYLNSL